MQRLLYICLTGVLLLASFGCWAHAGLVSTTPAENSVLNTAPQRTALIFDEAVSPLKMRLVTPKGQTLKPEKVQANNKQIDITWPQLEQKGSYIMSWRVISVDGHPVGGSYVFSIGHAGQTQQLETSHPLRDTLIWSMRLLWISTLVLIVGAALSRAISPNIKQQSHISAFALAGLAILAGLANLALLGVDALDVGLAALWAWPSWQTAINTSFSAAVVISWAAIGIAFIALVTRFKRSVFILAAFSLGYLGLSFSVSGHASTAPPQWLARPMVWVHVVSMGFWLGILWPLYYSLKQQHRHLLSVFSKCIPLFLLTLIISGTGLVILQLTAPADLWQTAYGRILAAKLIAVSVLLAVGAHNRYRLTQPALQRAPQAIKKLQKSIIIELILAIIILGLVSGWRLTPPPRTLEPVAATQSIDQHGIKAKLTIAFTNNGQIQKLSVRLYEQDKPLDAKQVQVKLSRPNIEPISIELEKQGNQWVAPTLTLPKQNHWHVKIRILVNDFKRVGLTAELD